MKRSLPALLASALLAPMQTRGGEGDVVKPVVVPAEFRSSIPDLPREKNGIARLIDKLDALDPSLLQKLTNARVGFDQGKPVEDAKFLAELSRWTDRADRLLKPPVQCLRQTNSTPFGVLLLNLFKSDEVLGCQAALEGDRQKADLHWTRMLRWSDLVRHAEPTMIEYLMASGGKRMALSRFLWDWKSHPDQKKRILEIEEISQKNRGTPEEWREVIRREVRWWAAQGGTVGIFKALEPSQTLAFMLRKPFSEMTAGAMLELPYDAASEADRYFDETRKTLSLHSAGRPLREWPVFTHTSPDLTLEDYRTRPNGLGDLASEQADLAITRSFHATVLAIDPMFETALLWIKAEQRKGTFAEDDPRIAKDPITGVPLAIDGERRIVRCVGGDGRLDEANGPLPACGFGSIDDDPIIVVPRWRDRE